MPQILYNHFAHGNLSVSFLAIVILHPTQKHPLQSKPHPIYKRMRLLTRIYDIILRMPLDITVASRNYAPSPPCP